MITAPRASITGAGVLPMSRGAERVGTGNGTEEIEAIVEPGG
jgi:hypothetical protein